MKKISLLTLLCATAMTSLNCYGYDNAQFRREVLQGVDVVTAQETAYVVADDAPGELGLDVYQKVGAGENDAYVMFIPTTMYIRAGAGLNLGFASDKAQLGDTKYDLSGGWSTQMGLGFNLSSYVRTEIDFQTHRWEFSDLSDAQANARSLGGTLYFDFARRYVRLGDITKRRTFVPYMGLGAGVGSYRFEGPNGADGFFVAPRGILGFNIMLTNLIGIDIAYQYQMFIGNGFGWDVRKGGVQNLSDVMVSFRMNF